MKPLVRTIKRFLAAEEVPRWFGLSIVLIYLVGLGSVAHFGVAQARREEAAYYRESSRYAAAILARQLSALADAGTRDAQLIGAFNRELREFRASIPTRSLRIVDRQRRVIASSDPGEIGIIASVETDPLSGGPVAVGDSPSPPDVSVAPWRRAPGKAAGTQRESATWIRIPIRFPDRGSHGLQAPEARRRGLPPNGPPWKAGPQGEPPAPEGRQAGGTLFLEALLPPDPFDASSPVGQAETLLVVLAVLGALFVVYRCLRGQLRSAKRIADRLQHISDGDAPCEGRGSPATALKPLADRLEQQLDSLRISAAAGGLDAVAAAWNEFVDWTRHLLETAQRSEADRELSHALERTGSGALADALSAVPDGIMYITDEVRIEYVNAAAQRFFGWETKEAKQMTLTDAQATGIGAQVLDLIRSAQQSDGSFEARTAVLEASRDPGGSAQGAGSPAGEDAGPSARDIQAGGRPPGGEDRSSYRVRITPLQRPHSDGECVVVIRDVSQQVRADRAREEFITQVTHELRTPLTNIRAYAETLSSGMFDDPSVITECYNVITKETRRLSRLISDMLSVSQLEVGTIDLQVDRVDLKTLLSDAVRDVRSLADEKNLDLQLILPAKLEPIQGDRDKLAVVLNNLLGNAIKYTPADGNVLVGCQSGASEVVITVKDNGIGIDPVDQAHVFEKFHRSKAPEVQAESGTGIGLFTAREIVRRHGGDIELMSEKGQGTTFLVRLPGQATRSGSGSVPGGDLSASACAGSHADGCLSERERSQSGEPAQADAPRRGPRAAVKPPPPVQALAAFRPAAPARGTCDPPRC